MAHVIAVSSNKGGVCKTSVATNLAAALADRQGKKVLIIDTDNQGNAALSFGKNPDQFESNVYSGLMGKMYRIVNVYKNVDLIPANDDMCFFEFDVLTNRKKFPQPFLLLKGIVEDLRNQYDYIIIDTPPNLGLTQGNVLTAADSVLIPFQPETFAMRGLIKTIQAIREFKKKYNPNLSILGILATLVDNRTVLHSEVLQECRRLCDKEKIRMFETVIPRSIRSASSVAYDRLPVVLTDKSGTLTAAYIEFTEEVLQHV